MSTTPEYENAVSEIAASFEEFNALAESGKDGRGSKTAALKARKASMKITEQLKAFRKLSIANDKA